MVTHQLQVERRTGKVRRPETDVLPLSHTTNHVYMLIENLIDEEIRCLRRLSPFRLTFRGSRRPRGGALVLHSVGLLRSVTAGHNPASSNALSLAGFPR